MTLYNLSQNKIAKQCFHTLFKQTCIILTIIKLSIKLWKEIIMIIIYFDQRWNSSVRDADYKSTV